jgi:hypothetical protein
LQAAASIQSSSAAASRTPNSGDSIETPFDWIVQLEM